MKTKRTRGFPFYATGATTPTTPTTSTTRTTPTIPTSSTRSTLMTQVTNPTQFTTCPHLPRVFLRRGALQSAPTVLIPLAFCLLAACAPAHTASLEALELAEHGVSANGEWQPALQSVYGVTMALVPAGCLQMGSTDAQLEEAFYWCERFIGAGRCTQDFTVEQPAHEVCFDEPFWIDQLEVSNRAYGAMYETDRSSPFPFERDWDWPRDTVGWDEADAFCRSRGARLPTEAEWEYAARGPDAPIYPWGNTFNPDDINWHSGHPYKTGEKEEWVSWVGAYDLAGGIAEWVDGWYAPYGEPQAGAESGLRIARGGHWFSRTAYFWRGAAREPLVDYYRSSTVGFRCAADFEEIEPLLIKSSRVPLD